MMVAIKNTKFRNDNNQRYTKQLFWDMQREMPIADRLIDPMYSLHDDVEGVINFRRCYVEDMDTTGYKTANRLLENYDHWNLLMRGKWFKEAKAEWDKEIAARMEQEATDTLMAIIRLKNEDVKVSEQISAAAKVFSRVDKMNNPNLSLIHI